MSVDGAPEFAALGLRARDAETIDRVHQALFARGYSDPYLPGHVPAEGYGAYSTFIVVPDGEVVTTAGIPALVVDAAQVAYALGATRVSVWAEDVDRVIPPTPQRDVEPQGYEPADHQLMIEYKWSSR